MTEGEYTVFDNKYSANLRSGMQFLLGFRFRMDLVKICMGTLL